MNCKKCGAENVDGAKFCCKCGSPLDTPEKNTKINFSDINVEKILSNDKIPKQVKDIINKIMQLPRKVLIGAVAGIVVLIVLIGAVRSHGRTIDLNKYLTINTSGYNGYGSVTAEVDWDSFEEKYDSKISYKKKNLLNKLERFLWDDRSPMNFLEGNVSVSIENDGTYFSIRQDQKSTYLRKICVENLLKRNFNVSSFHHEVGPGQNEINYLFSDPMSIADTFYIYKETIKETALKNKCIATFLPKPFKGLPGSGMHINCSIWNFKKNNMFYDETNEHHFSDFGINFTNGILRHIKALTALSATIDNSYLRLHSGLESPSGIFYSFNDREAAIRIPSAKQSRTRIELRFVDSTAQLYLLLAGIISAGIDGLEHPLRKGDENDILPKGLLESLKYLEEDEILNNCFGRKIIQKYIYEKKKEKIVPFRKLVMDY